MAEHSEDFGQMGQTCVECSPCWPHRGGYGRCPCDCHPADPIADLEHAMAVIDRLSDENERLRAEVDRMRAAVVTALAELDEEHRPLWSSDEAAAKGKAPIGCARCWPGDGHWPCSSRLIADDLRAALSGSKEDDRG